MLLRRLSGQYPRNPTYHSLFQISRRIGLTYAQNTLNTITGRALRKQGSYFLEDRETVLHYPTLRRSTQLERKSTILELQPKLTQYQPQQQLQNPPRARIFFLNFTTLAKSSYLSHFQIVTEADLAVLVTRQRLDRSILRERLCRSTRRQLCFSLTCLISLPIQFALLSFTQRAKRFIQIHPLSAIT